MTVVSLRPEHQDARDVPLDQQISRVTREHGSFAGLNEQSLASRDEDKMDVESPEVEVAVENDTVNERSAVDLRRELSAKIATALNEAALDLDFVSLLVSSSRPQAGNASISPMLRSQVPNGSLNAAAVASPAPALPATPGLGWKVKKYRESAAVLDEAALRLRAETHMEATFWRGVLAATSAGEVINRKLQIKYGFKDSGSGYADRGIGKIARDTHTGEPLFIAGPGSGNSAAQKLVQVSVFADQAIDRHMENAKDESYNASPEPDRLLGRAVVSYEFALEPLGSLLRSIRQERGTLFELELMQQLIQEARRDLGSHKVRLVEGGIVVCELFGGRIEIELVDTPPPVQPGAAFHIAEAINYSLHLLLVHQFHKRLESSHGEPKPLETKQKPSEPTKWKILQPVLAHIQHGILMSRILKLVNVLLPNARTEHDKLAPASLSDAVSCTIHVHNGDHDTIDLEVRSPITDSNDPIVVVTKNDRKTKIFDLTELEVWLKWAAFNGKPSEQ